MYFSCADTKIFNKTSKKNHHFYLPVLSSRYSLKDLLNVPHAGKDVFNNFDIIILKQK